MSKCRQPLPRALHWLVIAATLTSCVDATKNVELTVLCSGLGSTASDKVPKDLAAILSGASVYECNDTTVVVKPRFITYSPNEVVVNISPPRNSQEEFFASESVGKMAVYMDSLRIGKELVHNAKFDWSVATKHMTSYDLIIVYNEDPARRPELARTHIATGARDSVLIFINQAICTKNSKNVLVCYNILGSAELEHFDEEKYEAVVTKLFEVHGPKRVVLYQDSVISGLRDFRDAYAAMKSTITTTEHSVGHHTSFLALAIAMEWALRSGNGDDLVQMIGRDYSNDEKLPQPERTIWKLSTHKEEYNPLFQALQTKDSVELRKLHLEIRDRIKDQVEGLVHSDHDHEHDSQPEQAAVRAGGIGLSVASKPDYILTKRCAGPTPRVVLVVNGRDGRPIPRSTITLDASAVSWISSPALTREATGAMSVQTNEDGAVSLSIRQPERFGGMQAVKMKFAFNGNRADEASIASVSIPICDACNPCN